MAKFRIYDFKMCPVCDGSGYMPQISIEKHPPRITKPDMYDSGRCVNCNGKGKIIVSEVK